MEKSPKVSIILPCLNEEESIGIYLDSIKEVLKNSKISSEIIVVDNASSDKSKEIVKNKKIKNLKIIEEKTRGYGSAYLRGIKESKGEYIFMTDSDGTYDFRNFPRFVKKLEQGNDFVIG
ncbi:MAG TPA: glycosyltransferase family 2 protein, partial [Candidatus Nanoarchaeia archaeon]|nr:glycosyltransferase family 2 protein [Candidatus Nanoarchaeia archaeon]